MFIFIVAFSVTPINWRSREIKALAPLMACVSKPMRMKDFPFQPADTLFQYSLLKTTQQTLSICIFHRTPENITTCTVFFFFIPVHFSSPFLSKTPFFFFRCTGLAAKNSLHVFATQSRRLRESGRVEERATQSQEIEDGM